VINHDREGSSIPLVSENYNSALPLKTHQDDRISPDIVD
jgi:hypothetical protein